MHLGDATREPALVQVWKPLRRILAALLRTVHRGASERQVQQVGSEPALRRRICCATSFCRRRTSALTGASRLDACCAMTRCACSASSSLAFSPSLG